MKQLNRPRSALPISRQLAFLCAILCLSGCGTMGNSKVVQQLQNENDRLLAEFRAQRDQNSQLSQRLTETQARLAESEKLLARLSPPSGSRLSRLGNEPATSFQSPAKTRSTQPIADSKSSGTNTAANSSNEAAGQPVDFQWRPMRKEPR